MDARTNSGARDASAGRATARPAATVTDSDYGRKLGFKFRDTVTVTVTARFKFKVRGLGLGGYEDSDSDSEAACRWIPVTAVILR